MTNTPPAGTIKDARLVQTEILLPKPKRFVREALVMPDGYECDWYYVDTPPSVMIVPVTAGRQLVLVRLRDSDGIVGVGEAAPLPSYDGVGIEEVLAALSDCRELLARSPPAGLAAPSRPH